MNQLCRGYCSSGSLSARQVVALARNLIAPDFLTLIFGGLTLTIVVIAIQLGTTKLGISPQKLAPDFKRLNPLPKLTGLPGQNLPIFFQALSDADATDPSANYLPSYAPALLKLPTTLGIANVQASALNFTLLRAALLVVFVVVLWLALDLDDDEILGVEIPYVKVPITPGKNITVIARRPERSPSSSRRATPRGASLIDS